MPVLLCWLAEAESDQMTSDFLQNHPAFIPRLADLCGREWAHLYKGWTNETARQEFETQRTDGQLPLSLVALEDGKLLGAVSVIYDDLPGFEHLNPWLASLFVLPEHRGKNIGVFLVREAEKLLAQNGIPAAWLFTESAQGFFAKAGWRQFEDATCNGHAVAVFKKEFF